MLRAALLPLAMAVTPWGRRLFIGDGGCTAWPAAMLLLALAAPVLADSIIFLKKPLFLGLGAVKPPNTPPDSPMIAVSPT
jgi:hypothetical protein